MRVAVGEIRRLWDGEGSEWQGPWFLLLWWFLQLQLAAPHRGSHRKGDTRRHEVDGEAQDKNETAQGDGEVQNGRHKLVNQPNPRCPASKSNPGSA